MEGITDDVEMGDGEAKKVDDDDAAEMMVVKLDTEEKTRSGVNPEEYDNADPKDYGIEVESDDEYKYRESPYFSSFISLWTVSNYI